MSSSLTSSVVPLNILERKLSNVLKFDLLAFIVMKKGTHHGIKYFDNYIFLTTISILKLLMNGGKWKTEARLRFELGIFMLQSKYQNIGNNKESN